MIIHFDPILIASIMLPLVAAAIAAVSNRRVALYSGVILFMPLIAYSLYGIIENFNYLVPLFKMPKPIGTLYFIADGLSNAFGFTIAIVTAMIAVFSDPYMEHRFRVLGLGDEFRIYYPLFLLCGASMEWIVYGYNLLLIYIGLEVSLISSFLLIYFYGYDGYGKTRRWIGVVYFVYTHIASLLFLIGAFIIAFYNNTMDLYTVKYIPLIAWILILIGMLIKLPSFGPHVWLPWAHGQAPPPVAALIISIVGLAAYILARLYLVSPYFIDSIRTPLLAYAIFGGLLVSLATFKQRHNYKWVLAYSTIANMAYLLAGLTLGTYGIIGLTLHYIAHELGKATLFMTAGGIIVEYEVLEIDRMGGLQTYIPSIGGAALLGWMSLTGMFTVGLLGEFFILLGFWQTFGLNIHTLWAFIGLVTLFIFTGAYGFWALKEVFYGQPRWPYTKVKVNPKLVVPLYVLGLISVVLLFPPLSTSLIHSVYSAIEVIIHG